MKNLMTFVLALMVPVFFTACEQEEALADDATSPDRLAQEWVSAYEDIVRDIEFTGNDVGEVRMASIMPHSSQAVLAFYAEHQLHLNEELLESFMRLSEKVDTYVGHSSPNRSLFQEAVTTQLQAKREAMPSFSLRSGGKMQCLKEYDERNWKIVENMGKCAMGASAGGGGLGYSACGFIGLTELGLSRIKLEQCLAAQ